MSEHVEICPAGITFVANIIRLGSGELAQSFLINLEVPIDAETLAVGGAARAAEHIDRGAPAGLQLVMTLNLIDAQGRGGCSWQCLGIGAPIDRPSFAKAVGAVMADMLRHAVRCYARSQNDYGDPRTKAARQEPYDQVIALLQLLSQPSLNSAVVALASLEPADASVVVDVATAVMAAGPTKRPKLIRALRVSLEIRL